MSTKNSFLKKYQKKMILSPIMQWEPESSVHYGSEILFADQIGGTASSEVDLRCRGDRDVGVGILSSGMKQRYDRYSVFVTSLDLPLVQAWILNREPCCGCGKPYPGVEIRLRHRQLLSEKIYGIIEQSRFCNSFNYWSPFCDYLRIIFYIKILL